MSAKGTPWRKLHSQAPQDPKVDALAAALKIDPVKAFGHLCVLWCWSTNYAPDGDLGGHSDAVIARAARWPKAAAPFIQALADCGWLDRDGERLSIHNAMEYVGSYERAVKRKEQRQASRDRVATVARQDGDCRTETRRDETGGDQKGPDETDKTRAADNPSSSGPSFEEKTAASHEDLERLLKEAGLSPYTSSTSRERFESLAPTMHELEWGARKAGQAKPDHPVAWSLSTIERARREGKIPRPPKEPKWVDVIDHPDYVDREISWKYEAMGVTDWGVQRGFIADGVMPAMTDDEADELQVMRGSRDVLHRLPRVFERVCGAATEGGPSPTWRLVIDGIKASRAADAVLPTANGHASPLNGGNDSKPAGGFEEAAS